VIVGNDIRVYQSEAFLNLKCLTCRLWI